MYCNQDPCPSVSENAVFRKYAEFQYNFHLRSLIVPRSREDSRQPGVTCSRASIGGGAVGAVSDEVTIFVVVLALANVPGACAADALSPSASGTRDAARAARIAVAAVCVWLQLSARPLGLRYH